MSTSAEGLGDQARSKDGFHSQAAPGTGDSHNHQGSKKGNKEVKGLGARSPESLWKKSEKQGC